MNKHYDAYLCRERKKDLSFVLVTKYELALKQATRKTMSQLSKEVLFEIKKPQKGLHH